MRQLGLALQSYHAAHKTFPVGGSSVTELSWHVGILPYLEQSQLFDGFSFSEGSYLQKGKNDPHGLHRVPLYLCPDGGVEKSLVKSDGVNGEYSVTTHYYGSMGPKGISPRGGDYRVDKRTPGYGDFGLQGMFGRDLNKTIAEVTDGTSQSIAVGELSWNGAMVYRTWLRGSNFHWSGSPMTGCKNVYNPINVERFNSGDATTNNFNDVSFGSQHAGGTHLLFVDGHVAFISETTDTIVYKSMSSIDGGESE